MTALKNFRVDSFVSGLAIKAPCIIWSDVDITLEAEQTVNGVALLVGDRVLVANQTDPIENGIYTVETSAWNRAGDWDGNRDAVDGSLIPLTDAAEVQLWQMRTASDPFEVGVSTPTFTLLPFSDYESGTFTLNWLGWSPAETSTARYKRIGNMVFITIMDSLISATSDETFKWTTDGDIPTHLLPLRDQILLGQTKSADNGGLFEFGYAEFDFANSRFRFIRDAINTAYTASGTCTVQAGPLMYQLD